MYDVIIIGAGPAGLTLARLLGSRRKVLLLDARPMPDDAASFFSSSSSLAASTSSTLPFNDASSSHPSGQGRHASSYAGHEKCCGGLLAPVARKWLNRHGLSIPAAILDVKQPELVRALDLSVSLERVYTCPYVNINRNAFEAWLASLVGGDVDTLRSHRCVKIEKDAQGFTVTLKSSHGHETKQGKMIVGADGANSTVRRFLKKEPRAGIKYLALQDIFEITPESAALLNNGNEYLAFFAHAATDFYGWAIPKNNKILLGAALPPVVWQSKDAAKRMDYLKDLLYMHGYNFKMPFTREGCMLLRPHPFDLCHGVEGAFLAGEAAGFISASSAEGYSYAFASAHYLAHAILNSASENKVLKNYKIATLPLVANMGYKSIKSCLMYSAPLRRTVMSHGFLSKI